MSVLRALDERVLPAVARALRRVTERGGSRTPAGRPRPGGPLRVAAARLDHRYARRGVLGVVAALPALGFAVVGVLLVAGAVGVVRNQGSSAGASPGACTLARSRGAAYVGPVPTETVAAYAERQRRLLAACAVAEPQAATLAVVSLSAASRPLDAAAALRGVSVPLVFVAVPAQADAPHVLPLTGADNGVVRVGQAITSAYAAAAVAYRAQAAAERATAARAAGVTARSAALAFAASSDLAAGELATLCHCVYGAVVDGTVAAVADLVSSDVRVIALAPRGTALTGLTARPVLPAEMRLTGAAGPTYLGFRVIDDLAPAGLRPVVDGDAEAVQALVGGCFAAYPGCVLELDGLDAWMRAPAAGYAAKGGELFVLPGPAGLAACCGWQPGSAPDALELKSLYVAASARRRGVGGALVALVERTAVARGAAVVELWSDTRFEDAHRLYERLGYARRPGTRALHDRSQSIEYTYAKIL